MCKDSLASTSLYRGNSCVSPDVAGLLHQIPACIQVGHAPITSYLNVQGQLGQHVPVLRQGLDENPDVARGHLTSLVLEPNTCEGTDACVTMKGTERHIPSTQLPGGRHSIKIVVKALTKQHSVCEYKQEICNIFAEFINDGINKPHAFAPVLHAVAAITRRLGRGKSWQT
eukprot:1153748-Pelagomonas_calceolata.AAC.3